MTALEETNHGINLKKMCSVRLKGLSSDWFPVNVGLKQGCLISPSLFNLYINDLACKIKESGLGVSVHNEVVSLLMYADDLVLVSENEKDLQSMLNILDDWCSEWNVMINEQKSKVMHFRNKSVSLTASNFTCGTKNIEKCTHYKYLGLMLNEFYDYEQIAKHVAQSAHRALCLLIAKDKAHGGFDFEVFTKLYDSLVSSIIEYGAAVWGHKSYSCIEAVQHRACRYYLGLGKKAPNRAVEGDMGWHLPEQRQWLCILRHWFRLCNMNVNTLCSKIFRWSIMKASLNIKNWSYRVQDFLRKNKLENCKIDSGIVFNNVKPHLMAILRDISEDKWLKDVNRPLAKTGIGGNKLRNYKLFKSKLEAESYVSAPIKKTHRRALAQFRSGTAPINVELMRYGPNATCLADRKCISCDEVEDEIHVLFQCPLYTDIREYFNDHIQECVNEVDFSYYVSCNDTEKMNFILTCQECIKLVSRTCYEILERRRVLTYV